MRELFLFESKESFYAYKDSVESKVAHDGKLTLYYQEREEGGFNLYAYKHPRIQLAEALPYDQITVEEMQRNNEATVANAVLIPLKSREPNLQELVKETVELLIPRFLPYAVGKKVEFYQLNQSRTKEEPMARVVYQADQIVVDFPNQKQRDNP